MINALATNSSKGQEVFEGNGIKENHEGLNENE